MSLKAFHFFFIVVSVLFSAYFANWCFGNYEEIASPIIFSLGVGAVASSLALAGYLVWFLKKLRGIGFLALFAMVSMSVYPKSLLACASCIGNPNHPMVRATNEGVWFLMTVILAVLAIFAGLFAIWGIRSREINPA